VAKYNNPETLTQLANFLKGLLAEGKNYNGKDVGDFLGISNSKIVRMKQRLKRIIDKGIATAEEILPKGIIYKNGEIKQDPKFLNQKNFVTKLGFNKGKDDRERVTTYKANKKVYPELHKKINSKQYGFINSKTGYSTEPLYLLDNQTANNFKKELKLTPKQLTPEENTKFLKKIANYLTKATFPITEIKSNSPFFVNLGKRFNLKPESLKGKLTELRKEIKTNKRNLNLSSELNKKLARLPTETFTVDRLEIAGYGKKSIKKLRDLEKATKAVSQASTNFEHALPQSVVRLMNLPRKYLVSGERTSEFLNQFKKQYDNKTFKAAQQYLKDNDYKKYKAIIDKARNTVALLTGGKKLANGTVKGGYQMGYVDFVNGQAKPITPNTSFLLKEGELGVKTTGLKKFFKNAEFHNRLYENFTKNPNLKIDGEKVFGTLEDHISRSKFDFVPETELEETYKVIRNFTKPQDFYKFYQKNPSNPFFKAIASGISKMGVKGKAFGLGLATMPFLASALSASETNQMEGQVASLKQPQVNQPTVGEPLKYDATQGSIVNANTDQKADQNQILEYVKDNPLKVTAGASLGFAAQEVPSAYKAARDLGRGRIRSTLGISGALRPVLTTFGTPLLTGLYEGAIGAKRLEDGETMTDVLTDPVGPALGLSLMEPLSKLSGVVKDAPKRTMLEGAKNYFNLSNVGQARPGITGQILRMGMSPKMIAGASRFLGLPGLALGLGMSGYDAYKNYQNQEGMIYNLFNKDE